MSKALPGSHFCERHQGNHSHYAAHNCELCVAIAERDRLRELLREAAVYLPKLGWGKPGVDLPDRIDAELGGEGS